MKRSSIILAGALLLISANIARAHLPIFVAPLSNSARSSAVHIDDPNILWAVYAQLTKPNEVDYYTFEGKQGQKIAVSLLVPKVAALANFGVDAALIGQGFEQPAQALPFVLQSGEGAVVQRDSAHNSDDIFDEPFTGTAYWNRQIMNAVLPSDGTFTLAVYNTQRAVGKYVLAIGEKEVYGFRELLNFPKTRSQVRAWTATPLDDSNVNGASADVFSGFPVTALIVLIVGALALALLRLVIKQRRQTWDASSSPAARD